MQFFPISGSWDGLSFQTGSAGTISHAVITEFRDIAIEIADADIVLTNSAFFDPPGFAVTHDSTRFAIKAGAGADVTVDGGTFADLRGRRGTDRDNAGGNSAATGSNGTGGLAMTAIEAIGAGRLSVTNVRFLAIQGGDGGNGGGGGQGTTGDDAPDAILGNGVSGGPGGTGGRGGNGGSGGGTKVIVAEGVGETRIAQNVFEVVRGGRGGRWGKGGNGGTGGQGGDGAGAVVGNGATGGNGGRGGTGGLGGTGGTSGELDAIRVVNPGSAPIIANNTIYRALARNGGAAGAAGNAGNGGAGGAGGGAGIGGSTGTPGSTGLSGSVGTVGSTGANGSATVVSANGVDANGLVAVVSNNIITMSDNGSRRLVESEGNGIIDLTSNLAFGFSVIADGPSLGVGSLINADPLFTDPDAGDFALIPGSPAIDAGDNALVPGVLTTDFLGNPRFADELTTPDTGSGGDFIVDHGAIEAVGDSVQPSDCPADTNGDGLVTPADFNSWIIAFNAQADACDQNGDGLCTPADFNAWILNFNAGCP